MHAFVVASMSKVYVRGAEIGRPEGIDDRDLEDKFGKFGRIDKIWVARQPPGFAFIDFEDDRDAEDAVKALDNTEIRGCNVTVLTHV